MVFVAGVAASSAAAALIASTGAGLDAVLDGMAAKAGESCNGASAAALGAATTVFGAGAAALMVALGVVAFGATGAVSVAVADDGVGVRAGAPPAAIKGSRGAGAGATTGSD